MRGHALVTLVLLACAAQAAADGLVVVVHPSRPIQLRMEEIARIYLKQQRFWEAGDAILPINREARSKTRQRFERAVFGARVEILAEYWNREYFRGVLPPVTLASDEAVRRFVANEPRAIGYLPTQLVNASVHVAARLETSPQARDVPAPRSALRATPWEMPYRGSALDRGAGTPGIEEPVDLGPLRLMLALWN